MAALLNEDNVEDLSTSVVGMIQVRLKEIHESLHALRDDVHAALNSLTNKVISLEEWRKNHEQHAWEKDRRLDSVEKRQDAHEKELNYLRGAYGALKVLGTVILGLVSIAEVARFFAGRH